VQRWCWRFATMRLDVHGNSSCETNQRQNLAPA